MAPELSSASMAICLPGIASRVNLADTSATRPAPVVTTVNWITTRIRKITRPMTMLPPTTKPPNVSITAPPWPSDRISRVVEMLSASRKRVVTNNSAGNTLNCNGSSTIIEVNIATRAMAMLRAIITSMSGAGNGTIIITTMLTMRNGMPSCDMRRAAVWGWVMRPHLRDGTRSGSRRAAGRRPCTAPPESARRRRRWRTGCGPRAGSP